MNINLKEKIKKTAGSSGQEKNNRREKANGKNLKKIAIFQLLFIFALILLVPAHNAQAGIGDWISSGISSVLGGVGDIGKGLVEGLLRGLFLIIYNIGNLALNIAGVVVFLGAWLVDVMMDQTLYDSVLTSTSIQVGWTTIRDFCNMFFIFFLLIVAFSTILRISEYSAKAIIPKFLIAIFLINFSMEIAKLVIDFGQVFMYEIKGWMGDFSGAAGGGSSLTSIVDYFNEYFNASLTAITIDSAIAVLFAAAYSFMLGFTYIMMAGFLLIRLLMFAILIILSPFAFFCNVFPGTRQYSKQWWGSIVKYSLFGPIFIFFVFISATMAFELTSSFVPGAIAPTGLAAIDSIQGLLQKMIPNVIALMMLWMAIPITQKLGIAGSSRLIGGTMGLGAVAMGSYGAAKLAGGWGAKGAGWGGRRLGIEGRQVKDSLYGAAGGIAKKVGDSKIPVAGRIGAAVHGEITMKQLEQKAKDREGINKYKSEVKEADGKTAMMLARNELRKKDSPTGMDAMSEQGKLKYAAFIEHAMEKGENVVYDEEKNPDGFKKEELDYAKSINMDADKLAKFDPYAAAKLKKSTDGKGEDEVRKEYMEEHAHSGEWRKYSGHVREEHLADIIETVDDAEQIRDHAKKSGFKVKEQYAIGGEKALLKTNKAMADAKNENSIFDAQGKFTGYKNDEEKRKKVEEAKERHNKMREKVAKVTGNFETAFGEIEEDEKGNPKIENGRPVYVKEEKKDSSGNVIKEIKIDTSALEKALKEFGGKNFKNLSNDRSKQLYVEHASAQGSFSTLEFKGMKPEDIELITKGLQERVEKPYPEDPAKRDIEVNVIKEIENNQTLNKYVTIPKDKRSKKTKKGGKEEESDEGEEEDNNA